MGERLKLGILGGMGPQATLVFYQRILALTAAGTDQEHIPTLIWSDTAIPDRTAAILSGNTQTVFERLLDGVKRLEREGCGAVAIPCNTAHYFADALQARLGIPLVNMVALTAAEAARRGWRKVGLLATDGTLQTGIYHRALAAAGLEAAVPTPEHQALIMSVIYDEIKAGKPGSPEKFDAAAQDLKTQGCDGTVVACTELSTYRQSHPQDPWYADALDVLAREVIAVCGYPLRNV